MSALQLTSYLGIPLTALLVGVALIAGARMLGSQGFEQTLSLWPASYSFFYPTKRAPKPASQSAFTRLAWNTRAAIWRRCVTRS